MEKLLNKQMAEFIEILESDKNLISEDVWTNHEKKEWFKLKQQELLKEALAEERERVRGIIDWELTPHGYESDDPQFERFAIKIKEKYKNKILSSLDPLTDK